MAEGMTTVSYARDPFAEDMGRLFELGFSSGLLTGITQHKAVKTYFGEAYKEDLSRLRFQPLYIELCRRCRVISTWDRDTLERWALLQLIRGYLGGLSFFAEYLESFRNDREGLAREIVYLQCGFSGRNSLGTYVKPEDEIFQELMEQFRAQGYAVTLTEAQRRHYSRRGEFLRADVLLLLKYGNHRRLLCIDVSVFALRSLTDAGDLTSVEQIQRILLREMSYLRSKSVFANLSIDTDIETTAPELLAKKLNHYFTAFSREDKESVKLIQAASYAFSFYQFLLQQHILKENDDLIFNVVGYIDRGISSMALKKEQLSVLETCAYIYQSRPSNQEINDERAHVLDSVRKAVISSFQNGRAFINALMQLAERGDGLHWQRHEELIEGFVGTREPLTAERIGPDILQLLPAELCEGRNVLEVHEELVKRELAGPNPYLFLTGTPGIGKTTAIVKFLKERSMRGEGFLFLYASPRKHVNLDIIKKFRDDEFGLRCDNLLALTANSAIIRRNQSRHTVHYYSKQRQDSFHAFGVDFISMDSEEAKKQLISKRHFEEIQEGLLIDKGEQVRGVLDSLCTALYASLEKPLSNAIVATVAIQSLKRTQQGKSNTLRHLHKIFQGVRSRGSGVHPEQMQRLSKQIQHVFVMIDEVTGDESGAEFVQGIHDFLSEYGLLKGAYGINTKIIVADASIVDPKIIKRHLEAIDYEPDKIYFRRAQEAGAPLSRHTFNFKWLPAVGINANAYPASALRLKYDVGVEVLQYDEQTYSDRSKQLRDEVQQRIFQDILSELQQPEGPQLLVYIQDKLRLSRLIAAIRKERGSFEKNKDYLEIHANNSEDEKHEIEKHRDSVRVVFMTASASRGLSFKMAKHILVDVPRFNVEQNLMEILQVIYRGRGGELDEEEKTISFYLTDRIVYTDDADRQSSVRESLLYLLNMLLILKTSIMTRIFGSGQIGLSSRFMMIPIGGKSVATAGDSLTSRMGRLIKELQDLSYRYPSDKRLEEVSAYLTEVLSRARIQLRSSSSGEGRQKVRRQSYIPLVSSFVHTFHEAACKGFHELLGLPLLETAYLAGGLLIVPIETCTIQEHYWMDVQQLLARARKERDVLTMMRQLKSHKNQYTEDAHILLQDAIELVEKIQQMEGGKLGSYEQESNHTDQHYAIPLLAFFAPEELKAYFESGGERDIDARESFRSLLISYIRLLYPANSLLPIGWNYDEFPFVLFRSFNLGEARRKLFTDHYLFMSYELNILNMLLADE